MATELMPKRLELLAELVPQVRVIALLVNPNFGAAAERVMRDVQEVARAKGVQLHILKVGTEGEIDTAFATLVQLHAGALLVAADSIFNSRREQLVALASRQPTLRKHCSTELDTGATRANTARGPLVDEEALRDALTSGHLRVPVSMCFHANR